MSDTTPSRADDGPKAPEPVSVVDGIPDRSARPAAWKYVLLTAVLLGWVAFLMYCAVAGDTK